MNTALTIIDGLLVNERALRIRDQALASGFKDFEFMQGIYQGTNVDFQPPDMKMALSRHFNANLKFEITAFRLGHEDTQLHVNIHADNPVAKWACVYYLNLPEQCKGGTAFYTLKETGWDTMPTQAQLEEKGKTLGWMTDKWQKEEAWQLNSIAGMKFNRCICYPSVYFHSRYPLQGWGNVKTPEECRLVWVGFFNILP